MTGRIHSWDLSTGVDGPGTRFVLFLSGCPLRCLYCANPDTWHMRDGKLSTVDEVMAEIEEYRPFITAAGGGVTLTGGESLLQPAFTARIFRRCQELGLHTALDTSGFLGTRAADELLAGDASAAGEVDDAEHPAGAGVAHGGGGTGPVVRGGAVVLAGHDLDGVSHFQYGARGVRPRLRLGPHGPLDEVHPLSAPHGCGVPLDPQQGPVRVSDREDVPVVRGTGPQQLTEQGQHRGQQMGTSVVGQLSRGPGKRRRTAAVGGCSARRAAPPRVRHQWPHPRWHRCSGR
ncbi:radical SAM protein [Streptomyces sp. ME02-8801-2C]|uniref:4Fe-4S cluster-binding domain-containing protein n=1 Tax=Streptomyces sp. ME02-8801-2C TaxID=3028680 RepID=UPI0029A59753|nr:4Fe-4S cluster-binding domain-containing protein [Streptomyces sp. ME02-8801-2C]MDX3458910.1 radical SAM protein [Streptomyces sp. ME02-8801-2C]